MGYERGAKASYPNTGAVTFDFSAAPAASAFGLDVIVFDSIKTT